MVYTSDRGASNGGAKSEHTHTHMKRGRSKEGFLDPFHPLNPRQATWSICLGNQALVFPLASHPPWPTTGETLSLSLSRECGQKQKWGRTTTPHPLPPLSRKYRLSYSFEGAENRYLAAFCAYSTENSTREIIFYFQI